MVTGGSDVAGNRSDNLGGILLCGGQSRRMGRPKALLPFGDECLLQRIARILAETVGPLVVVAAEGQKLPDLPDRVSITHDRRPDRGPLEGLAAGWAALPDKCDVAYVTSCDVPLLRADFVLRVLELAEGHDIAVPQVEERYHPLAAAYRRSVVGHVRSLLAEDRLRPFFLFERVDTRILTAEELVTADPELESLENLNRPEDYLRAARRAGITLPADILYDLGIA